MMRTGRWFAMTGFFALSPTISNWIPVKKDEQEYDAEKKHDGSQTSGDGITVCRSHEENVRDIFERGQRTI